MSDEKHEHVPGATASREALDHRMVEGWRVFTDGSANWIFDLDLAQRADLSRLRDVRPAIRTLIADGAVHLIGGAAAGVLADIRTGRAKKQPKKRTVLGRTPVKTGGNDGAGAGRAIIRAEMAVVLAGDRGRTQETVEFYLNREAAVLLLMRLRTPRAVELQCAVARVFVLVEEGRIGQRSDPRLDAALAVLAQIGPALESIQAWQVAADERHAKTEARLAKLEDALIPYVTHPETFPRQELRNARARRRKIRDLMLRLAAVKKVSFSRVHGLIRTEYKVTGYLDLHHTQFHEAEHYLRDLFIEEGLPAPASKRRAKPHSAGDERQVPFSYGREKPN